MTREKELEKLKEMINYFESMTDDECFDFFYNNSISFRKDISKLKEYNNSVEFSISSNYEALLLPSEIIMNCNASTSDDVSYQTDIDEHRALLLQDYESKWAA